jgi:hypothetical protein
MAAAAATIRGTAAAMTESRPSRRPGAGPVLWISLLLFCALLGLLTYRFSIGRDPSGASAGAEPAPVRKVIVRRVVTTVVPDRSAASPEAGAAASAQVSPEPAPAPEPEPVTTSSS